MHTKEDIPNIAREIPDIIIGEYTPQAVLDKAKSFKLTAEEYSGFLKGIQCVINDLTYWSRGEF